MTLFGVNLSRIKMGVYLHKPAWSSGTSPLQMVSIKPAGVSFCRGMGHFIDVLSLCWNSRFSSSEGSVSNVTLCICRNRWFSICMKYATFGNLPSAVIVDPSDPYLSDRKGNFWDDERVVPIWRSTEKHHILPPSWMAYCNRSRTQICIVYM